ncbi:hypothetical protein BDZ91DRAFT_768426 [Kalaharituber pfeilii]|nr:hypothetical protein BDZ91DRAFT_768426 [Kalaharituber pfeilii]
MRASQRHHGLPHRLPSLASSLHQLHPHSALQRYLAQQPCCEAVPWAKWKDAVWIQDTFVTGAFFPGECAMVGIMDSASSYDTGSWMVTIPLSPFAEFQNSYFPDSCVIGGVGMFIHMRRLCSAHLRVNVDQWFSGLHARNFRFGSPIVANWSSRDSDVAEVRFGI